MCFRKYLACIFVLFHASVYFKCIKSESNVKGVIVRKIHFNAMDQTDATLLTCPKLINKENSRSEIWHYFAYKTDDRGKRTELTTEGKTSNLAKQSLAHTDLFRELRD